MKAASGDIIFLSDQDDLWLDTKVKEMTSSLNEFDLVISDCYIIDSENKITSNSFFNKTGSKPGLLKNIIKNSYIGCCMAFKRELLNTAMPFPAKIPMHDWWIGLVGELFYKVKFINTPLMKYRRHGKNASFSGEKSQTSLRIKVRYRVPLIIGLMRLLLKKRLLLSP